MLVYGDRARTCDPHSMLFELVEPARDHAAIVSRFITAGELAQGLADAHGRDERTPRSDAVMRVLVAFAKQVDASWRGQPVPMISLAALAALRMPDEITCKRPEGYAFYALYPETYLEAARRAPPGHRRVIGIRSIGTGLAALVTAVTGGPLPATVRPHGDPFRREVYVSPGLLAEWRAEPRTTIAICDEGPGLSGSSFGAVADLLEGLPIEVYPSHAGDVGPMASRRHRERWARLPRRHVDFDELIKPRLLDWIGELVGAIDHVEDISAGRWRKYARLPDAPVIAHQERRKLRITADAGTFVARFAGLGHDGDRTLRIARALHAAGFTPEPIGLVHGFLVERWCERTMPLAAFERAQLVERVGAYLAFRAHVLRGGDGADATLLRQMVERNAGIDVPAPASKPRRVAIDGRLHAHEWLVTARGLLKADAYDHHAAHDLVGCQDIAWDVAGAVAELALTPDEEARVAAMVEVDPEQLAFARPCYAAFQLGRHALALPSAVPEEQQRLRREVERYRGLL